MNTASKILEYGGAVSARAALAAGPASRPSNRKPRECSGGSRRTESRHLKPPARRPAAAPPAAARPAAAHAPAPARSAAAPGSARSAAARAAPANRPAAAKTDRLDLGTATVTGDREQPKVMYIVPWKRSDIGDLAGKPMNSLVDEILSPVDRDVFKREVVYYRAVQADASQNGAAAKPCAAG